MAKGLKLTTDEFINRVTEVHEGFYDYSKTIYTAWDKDVVITCPVHGDFKVKAGKHIGRHQGCRKCRMSPTPRKSDGSPDFNKMFSYDAATGKLYWKINPAKHINKGDEVGCDNGQGYLVTNIKGKLYLVHRIIWEMFNGPIPKGMAIDHIDHNRANNRLENFRLVTWQDNSKNLKMNKRNKSGCCGVCWDKKRRKWVAQIVCRKVVQNLGAFDDWFEAVCARKSAEAKKGFHENHERKLWQS